ncbi:MAG: hypothetical protein LBB47_02105 [Spirochaetaceae bacterium]|nr:hypothetical protein [Spirochaetaceae bacterium]
MKKVPAAALPPIPSAAITVAGITWGISGSAAKLQAETNVVYASSEIEKLKPVETGFDALLARIAEGENLIKTLTGKLRRALAELKGEAETADAPGRIGGGITGCAG